MLINNVDKVAGRVIKRPQKKSSNQDGTESFATAIEAVTDLDAAEFVQSKTDEEQSKRKPPRQQQSNSENADTKLNITA